jgi:hypothetical protein
VDVIAEMHHAIADRVPVETAAAARIAFADVHAAGKIIKPGLFGDRVFLTKK